MILSDGESCKAGTKFEFTHSHTFNKNKKISKVDVIINKGEDLILQINFYSGEERLVLVGCSDDWVSLDDRVETFEISADEQLIGCELSYC